jgi:hypothetical protein
MFESVAVSVIKVMSCQGRRVPQSFWMATKEKKYREYKLPPEREKRRERDAAYSKVQS